MGEMVYSTFLSGHRRCSLAVYIWSTSSGIFHENKCSKEDGEKSRYDPPKLKDLVEVPDLEPCLYPGGETEALNRLEEHINMKNAKWVRAFEKPQTSPNALSPSTTVLSPYLKFGCLSPRLFYWKLDEVYKGSKHSQPPVSLHGQLLWREFFYTVGANTENFDKMKGIGSDYH